MQNDRLQTLRQLMQNHRDELAKVGAGLVLGLLFGLFIGWVVWPVKWTSATLDNLAPDLRARYVAAVADAYVASGGQEADLALERLQELSDPQAAIEAAIRYYQASNEPSHNIREVNLRSLASQVEPLLSASAGPETSDGEATGPASGSASRQPAESSPRLQAPSGWWNWLLTVAASLVLLAGGAWIGLLLYRSSHFSSQAEDSVETSEEAMFPPPGEQLSAASIQWVDSEEQEDAEGVEERTAAGQGESDEEEEWVFPAVESASSPTWQLDYPEPDEASVEDAEIGTWDRKAGTSVPAPQSSIVLETEPDERDDTDDSDVADDDAIAISPYRPASADTAAAHGPEEPEQTEIERILPRPDRAETAPSPSGDSATWTEQSTAWEETVDEATAEWAGEEEPASQLATDTTTGSWEADDWETDSEKREDEKDKGLTQTVQNALTSFWPGSPDKSPAPSRALGQFTAHYQLGIADYEQSFTISTQVDQTPEPLGACGMGARDETGTSIDKVTVLDVWLYDRRDIRSYNQLLVSAPVYLDRLSDAVESSGTVTGSPLVAEPGLTFKIHSKQLLLECRVVEAATIDSGPNTGPFKDVKVEMTVHPRAKRR